MSVADQLGHDENPAPVRTSHVVITTTKVSCRSPSGTVLVANVFLSPL
jgi:glycine/serine hydroxymethyltransferase